MNLRTRVAVLTAVAAAIAVVAVSVAAWFVARDQMRDAVDAQLRERAVLLRTGGSGRGPDGRRPGFIERAALVQRVGVGGVLLSVDEIELPVAPEDVAVVEGRRRFSLRDETVDGIHLRVLTVPVRTGGIAAAVTLAEPLTQVDESLAGLRRALVVLSALGVSAAAGLGLVVARRSLRPVEQLTSAARHVAATEDLDQRITVERDDELGSLAGSFNEMLAALKRSRDQQRRLVADASHELRTPLTSLRTNIEVLQRTSTPAADDDLGERIMEDVIAELDELTAIVTELVELATDRHEVADRERVDLAALVGRVVDRHRRRTDVEIELAAVPCEVDVVAALVERAVGNLIDNAVKFAGDAGPVHVTVADGRVVVDDSGPGIDPADRGQVFERFWRADAARSAPGSGLGLAIVKEIALAHGGFVDVDDAPGGGARFVLRLPLGDRP